MNAIKPRRDGCIRLLGIDFSAVTRDMLLDAVMKHIRDKAPASLVFLNVDVVLKSEKDTLLRNIIDTAEYVLADGMPLIWFSKLFHCPLPERITGSDFVPSLCRRAEEEGYSVFIAGGSETSLRNACAQLKKSYPALHVDGYSPPMGFEKDSRQVERLCRAINEASPDILVVCFGCPKQEKFIYENRSRYNAPVSVCAGATVDFLSGEVKRCPAWMSRSGLEWFYRFLQEPKRLFRRYFIDDMKILRLVLKYWKEAS
ncbi:MAG: WecB/TagA/CpsF family glycosyltransferase [Clostridium sp.]|nr:WecB/TagA/CpsF family glycosyltransferase [Clostridium sp.]